MSEKALSNIRKIAKTNKIPDIKRSIIIYLLKFSDPSTPDRHLAVDEIIYKFEKKKKFFRKELMDSTAVIAYHEILKAITEGNLTTALKYISKYAVLFRGDPNTPNYHEVDSFEKKFFQIIEERNLWDSL